MGINKNEEKWLEIEKKYGEEVLKAMKMLHAYYDGEGIARWIAGLFDPETGGFYYCNSARDTEGFLPDLESTSQALSILSEVGAIPTAELNEILPEKVKKKIIDFVLERQSPVDGYFYHPQWPQDKSLLATDRYGRDIGNATSVLRRVYIDADGDGVEERQRPRYCTVNGIKCARHEGTDEVCRFPIDGATASEPIQKNEPEQAPSPRSDLHPVYTSAEDFLAWLERYSEGIHVNSGRAHNLAALSSEINMHGYIDVLIDFIARKQKELFDEQERLGEEPTGIWQRAIDYRAVWGTYKYLYIYNTYDRAIDLKYVPYMVKTCLKVIKLPAIKNYAYNDLMNQWSAISGIIQNVKKHYGQDEANKIYDMVRDDAAALVENSLEKMLPFKMADGSFCNRVSGDTSAIIYGTPIAVGGLAEGNANSTHILLCMYYSICAVLGCPAVPLSDTDIGREIANILASKC